MALNSILLIGPSQQLEIQKPFQFASHWKTSGHPDSFHRLQLVSIWEEGGLGRNRRVHCRQHGQDSLRWKNLSSYWNEAKLCTERRDAAERWLTGQGDLQVSALGGLLVRASTSMWQKTTVTWCQAWLIKMGIINSSCLRGHNRLRDSNVHMSDSCQYRP